MSFPSNWITNSLRAGIVLCISNLQVGVWVLLGGTWSLLSNILRFLNSIVLLPINSSLRTQLFEKRQIFIKQTKGKKTKPLTHPKSYLQCIAHTFLPHLPLLSISVTLRFLLYLRWKPYSHLRLPMMYVLPSLQLHLRPCAGPVGNFTPQGFPMNSLFHLEYWLHSSPGYGFLILQASASSFCSLGEKSPNTQCNLGSFSYRLPGHPPQRLCSIYHNFYLAIYLCDYVMFVSS